MLILGHVKYLTLVSNMMTELTSTGIDSMWILYNYLKRYIRRYYSRNEYIIDRVV